jgi:hypothetical protein
MIRTRCLRWAFAPWCAALLHATPAPAAAPDPRAQASRLEDLLLEGEIDAEDFLAWRLTPGALGAAGRGSAYLGVEAFLVQRASGTSEMGALLVVELPLERFVQRGWAIVPTPFETASMKIPTGGDGVGAAWLGAQATEASVGPSIEAPWSSAGSDRNLLDEAPDHVAQTAPPRVERVTAPAITVTTDVARSCVRAALRAMGLGDDNRLDSVAARARSSAALPELRLRAVRTLGESGRISLSEDDPSRYVASGAASNVLEARVTFRLDRLLFADEEIVVERARLDRSELRSRTAAKVLQLLFEWQRAYALAQDAALSAEDRFAAIVREAESGALLDVMTGGWFGAYRAALVSRGP